MNRSVIILSALAAVVAGCGEPAAVELVPPPESPAFELTAIASPDTNYNSAPVDSSGVLPADQLRYAGFVTLNRLTFDNGLVVRSGAYSRVLFEDRNRPVPSAARRAGYFGLDLGVVTLNGSPMARIPHRIRVRRVLLDSIAVAGVEYAADLTATYAAGETYTWSAQPDSVQPFSLSIEAPDDVLVLSPAGGSTVRADRELVLRWTGHGPVHIVISGFDPGTGRTRPLLQIRPRVHTGRLVIPPRVLQMLPRDRFHTYAFSFVLANRQVRETLGGFQGGILIQAAAVATTIVQIP